MGHNHEHDHNLTGRKLLISTVLNFSITIVEIIGGIFSNSLALLSDALHNLGDAFAVLIAYLANKISKKPNTDKKTFGYKRIEILAALFNGVVLLVITIYLFIEAFKRIQNPEPIKGKIMLLVAIFGLLVNFISVILLKPDSAKNLNVKSAYLHLLGDTISSVAVILGAIIIYFFNWYWIDPIITFILGIYILKETISILKEVIDILMQSTPQGLEIEDIKNTLEKLPYISNIHHIHVWNLNDQEIHFECHMDLTDDKKISQTEQINANVSRILMNKFGIAHVTIQYEFNWCDDKATIHSSDCR